MIYVMSDIHGRSDRFESVFRQINLKEDDHLYVLGDVIDRNKGGIELLLQIVDMPNATVLLGNHELMARDCILHEEECLSWILNGGSVTIQEYMQLSEEKRQRFETILKGLLVEAPVEVNGKRFLLAHACPESAYPDDFEWEAYWKCTYGDVEKLSREEYDVWSRLESDEVLFADKTVVFGHTPTDNYQIGTPLRVWFGAGLIGIDCGCGSPNGRLACLRLDDMEVFYSKE